MPKISVPTNGGPGRSPGVLNTQTYLRVQRIARMEVAGVSDVTICKAEGLDYTQLKYLRSLKEFIELREDILQGHLTEMDKALAGKVELLRGELRAAVPAALRALVDTVNQRRDLRSSLAAAKEILDRDPDRIMTTNQEAGAGGGALHLPDAIADSISKETDSLINRPVSTKVN